MYRTLKENGWRVPKHSPFPEAEGLEAWFRHHETPTYETDDALHGEVQEKVYQLYAENNLEALLGVLYNTQAPLWHNGTFANMLLWGQAPYLIPETEGYPSDFSVHPVDYAIAEDMLADAEEGAKEKITTYLDERDPEVAEALHEALGDDIFIGKEYWHGIWLTRREMEAGVVFTPKEARAAWTEALTLFLPSFADRTSEEAQNLHRVYTAVALVCELLSRVGLSSATLQVLKAEEGEVVEFWPLVRENLSGRGVEEQQKVLLQMGHVTGHPDELDPAVRYLVGVWNTAALARLYMLVHIYAVFASEDAMPVQWREFNEASLQKSMQQHMLFTSRSEQVTAARDVLMRISRRLATFWGSHGLVDEMHVWMDHRGLPGRCSAAAAIADAELDRYSYERDGVGGKPPGAPAAPGMAEAIIDFAKGMVNNPQCATAMRAALFVHALNDTPVLWSIRPHGTKSADWLPRFSSHAEKMDTLRRLQEVPEEFWTGCPVDVFGQATKDASLHSSVADTMGAWNEWWASRTGYFDLAEWEDEHIWPHKLSLAADPSVVARAPAEQLAMYAALGGMWSMCMREGVVPCLGELRGEWRLQSHVWVAACMDYTARTTPLVGVSGGSHDLLVAPRCDWLHMWELSVGSLTKAPADMFRARDIKIIGRVSKWDLQESWVAKTAMYLFKGLHYCIQERISRIDDGWDAARFIGKVPYVDSAKMPDRLDGFDVTAFTACSWPV